MHEARSGGHVQIDAVVLLLVVTMLANDTEHDENMLKQLLEGSVSAEQLDPGTGPRILTPPSFHWRILISGV